MKKVYYLQKHEVKLGDVIECAGIRTILTEELIELNPELFSIEEYLSMDLWAYIPSIKKEPFKLGTQPMYFKSLKGIKPFTTGRVYKQVDSIGYPITIKLIADDNKEHTVYNWQSNYLHLNNNCFDLTTKAEWDKQELLDEAKRRYPIGTVYKHFNSEYTITSPDMLTVSEMDHHFEGNTSFGTSIWVNSETHNGVVYTDGKWAEILPLRFTSEDGVGIYGDMKTYMINSRNTKLGLDNYGDWIGSAESYKYFYHKENALAYIKKHKENTLEDYEEILFKSENNSSAVFSGKGSYFSIYAWIRDNEPKLYYTKILQLIADDLNDGWEPDFTNYDEKWCVAIKDIVHYINLQIHGLVYFKESKLAQKAKDILGDKVNYLFN